MPAVQPVRTLPPAARACAIRCLRTAQDPQAVEDTRVCLSNELFDWDAFEQVMYGERIAPLIHYRVGPTHRLPEKLEAGARQAYLRTAWSNSLLMSELERLLLRFAGAHIPVIVLKGPALILTVYEKSALRPMGDLDLLIREQDLDRARRVMIEDGYATTPGMFPSPYETEHVFTRGQSAQTTVELHTSLFQIPHLFTPAQLEWFWANSVSIPMGQVQVRVLAPEAQVLHLCAHLWLHHQGGDLLMWNDIYEVISRFASGMDWAMLFHTAQGLDLLIPLQRVLPELAQEWHAPIPAESLAHMQALQPTRREQRKFNRLWWQGYNFAELLLVDLMSLPGWRSRLRYAWYRFFPQPAYMIERYHVSNRLLLPYAYLVRWLTTFVHVRNEKPLT